jgi:hypothetical protein
MRKPRRKLFIYTVQWQEQYTYTWNRRDDLPDKTVTRNFSKRYQTERTARDQMQWLQQRLDYSAKGGRVQGWTVVPESTKLWRAEVGEWEEVALLEDR